MECIGDTSQNDNPFMVLGFYLFMWCVCLRYATSLQGNSVCIFFICVCAVRSSTVSGFNDEFSKYIFILFVLP